MYELHTLTREQTKIVDNYIINELGLPSVILMENAGHGIAQYLLTLQPNNKVIVCSGKGNNGGDGYVVARYLNLHKIDVEVYIFAHENDIKGDAKIHLDIIKKIGIPIQYFDPSNINLDTLLNNLNKAEWIIDGLFGTGLATHLDAFYCDLINTINKTTSKILSIDVPSGLDCDTGQPFGASIKANVTCTLLSMKKGFLSMRSQNYFGKIKIINLGVSDQIIYQCAQRN